MEDRAERPMLDLGLQLRMILGLSYGLQCTFLFLEGEEGKLWLLKGTDNNVHGRDPYYS